jgi:hypothetical protein
VAPAVAAPNILAAAGVGLVSVGIFVACLRPARLLAQEEADLIRRIVPPLAPVLTALSSPSGADESRPRGSELRP